MGYHRWLWDQWPPGWSRILQAPGFPILKSSWVEPENILEEGRRHRCPGVHLGCHVLPNSKCLSPLQWFQKLYRKGIEKKEHSTVHHRKTTSSKSRVQGAVCTLNQQPFYSTISLWARIHAGPRNTEGWEWGLSRFPLITHSQHFHLQSLTLGSAGFKDWKPAQRGDTNSSTEPESEAATWLFLAFYAVEWMGSNGEEDASWDNLSSWFRDNNVSVTWRGQGGGYPRDTLFLHAQWLTGD